MVTRRGVRDGVELPRRSLFARSRRSYRVAHGRGGAGSTSRPEPRSTGTAVRRIRDFGAGPVRAQATDGVSTVTARRGIWARRNQLIELFIFGVGEPMSKE